MSTTTSLSLPLTMIERMMKRSEESCGVENGERDDGERRSLRGLPLLIICH
jgi:hypothetical protein